MTEKKVTEEKKSKAFPSDPTSTFFLPPSLPNISSCVRAPWAFPTSSDSRSQSATGAPRARGSPTLAPVMGKRRGRGRHTAGAPLAGRYERDGRSAVGRDDVGEQHARAHGCGGEWAQKQLNC
jgi:hypothetical protein